MLSEKEANDLMSDLAYLECLGNLYEYAGTVNKKLLFQAVNDDTYILCDYEQFINRERYGIAYKG